MEEISYNALLTTCGQLLIHHQYTIAFAESATAGRISAEFALLSKAGKFLKGGIVCYDAALKESILGVPKTLIREFTPESAAVTAAITSGIQRLIPADIHIGCTGLTCAGGSETEDKPVGTMFICGMKGEEKLFSESVWFGGEQEEIVLQTVKRVAQLLINYLPQLSSGQTKALLTNSDLELSDFRPVLAWIEQSDVLLFAYNLMSRRFTFTNHAFKTFFGLRSFQIDPAQLLEMINPDDKVYFLSKFKAFTEDQKLENVEFRVGSGQNERWLKLSPFLVTEDDQRIVVGQLLNISHSKATIDVLNNHNIKKNSILTILAHDLAGPIGTVQNLSTMLKRETADLSNPRIDHFISLISKISKSNIHLIRNYINQEFLESAGTVLFKKRVDLVKKINITSETMLTIQDNLRIEYIFKANKDVIYAEIDEDKFMQVISNLITNALKFTPDGGKIEVNITAHEKDVLIFVRDNGIGIPKQHHATLFDKFTKARRTGIRGETSTGLGMSIIKTIVEWHQGTIWFESEENAGTTFYIRLPIQDIST